MTELTVRTEPLGGSPLVRAMLAGTAPPSWYAAPPRTPTEWRARLARLAPARGSGAWLDALRPALAPSGAAAARLARVVAEGGVLVTTGQQPGLFGGPIYTWSKALSALALADAIEEATGVPVAPLFWAATDDADFAESASTWVALPGGAERLVVPPPSRLGGPLADVPLGDVREQLATLQRAAGSAAYREPLELAVRAYGSDATVGGAYAALLRGLLEPLGVAVLDAGHVAVQSAADEFLRRALRSAAELERAADERAAELRAAGYEPQVSSVPGLSLVFDGRDGQKVRVPLARAAAVAADSSARLGSTVLLRPVLERHLLPTAAYVAGPGELAYFAQVSATAAALGVDAPLAVPRWSGTVVEPHVQQLLRRFDLAVDDLRDPHGPERALAQALLPAGLTGELAALREALGRGGAALRQEGESLLPAAVPDGFARRVGAQLDRLERRYRAAARRRHDAEFHDLGTVRGALYPGGIRQERALNLLPSLARHGPILIDRMRQAARAHAASLVGAVHEAPVHARPAAVRTAPAP